MKRCLLISLIGITLIGCEEEKKITQEMLIGEWGCDISVYEVGWKDGHFQDDEAPKVSHQKVKYFMNNNKLMATFDGIQTRPFNLAEIQRANKEETTEQFKLKTTIELNYVSNDEYDFKEIKELYLLNSTEVEQNKTNHKKQTNLLCKRIGTN